MDRRPLRAGEKNHSDLSKVPLLAQRTREKWASAIIIPIRPLTWRELLSWPTGAKRPWWRRTGLCGFCFWGGVFFLWCSDFEPSYLVDDWRLGTPARISFSKDVVSAVCICVDYCPIYYSTFGDRRIDTAFGRKGGARRADGRNAARYVSTNSCPSSTFRTNLAYWCFDSSFSVCSSSLTSTVSAHSPFSS